MNQSLLEPKKRVFSGSKFFNILLISPSSILSRHSLMQRSMRLGQNSSSPATLSRRPRNILFIMPTTFPRLSGYILNAASYS